VDRIEREGLPDLIQDMADLVALAKAHAELFARVDKIAGTAETAEELRIALRQMTDGKAARDLLASRNRAVASLRLALAENSSGSTLPPRGRTRGARAVRLVVPAACAADADEEEGSRTDGDEGEADVEDEGEEAGAGRAGRRGRRRGRVGRPGVTDGVRV